MSGNPGGRPKGAPALIYSVRQLVAEALSDPEVWKGARTTLQESFKARKSVVPALEFAARVNREIGLGSDQQAAGVTIIVQTNIRADRLRRST